MGTMREAGTVLLMTARLRIELGRIAKPKKPSTTVKATAAPTV